MTVKVFGVAELESLLRRLPVRTRRGQKALIWEACRELRTPMRRDIRNNVPRRRRRRRRRGSGRRRGRPLRSSIRIQIGTRRKPVFVVRGKNYLVPWNAQSQGVSKELQHLPDRVIRISHRKYEEWLRRNTR